MRPDSLFCTKMWADSLFCKQNTGRLVILQKKIGQPRYFEKKMRADLFFCKKCGQTRYFAKKRVKMKLQLNVLRLKRKHEVFLICSKSEVTCTALHWLWTYSQSVTHHHQQHDVSVTLTVKECQWDTHCFYCSYRAYWILTVYYTHKICTNKSCKFILKLLRHVSLSIHHLQTVYSCVS